MLVLTNSQSARRFSEQYQHAFSDEVRAVLDIPLLVWGVRLRGEQFVRISNVSPDKDGLLEIYRH